MPENSSGRPGVPAAGDSEQWIRDTLAEMRDTLAALTCEVADLAKRIGDAEAEAEDILRRAEAPLPPLPQRRRHHHRATFLRVVRALVIVTAGAALLVAAACYSRPAAASPARSWRVAAVHDSDGDWDLVPASSR